MTQKLSILIYHRVLPEPDPLFPDEVDAPRFEAQMRLLARWFRPLPLTEAIERLSDGSLPPRAVAVTFDDGYADNLTQAEPIAARAGVPLAVFVASGHLDGGIMWNDVVIESVRRCDKDTLAVPELDTPPLPMSDVAARRAAIKTLLHQLKYQPQAQRLELAHVVARRAGAKVPTDLMLSTNQLRQLRGRGVTIGAHTLTHPILTRLNPEEARRQIADGRALLERTLDEPIAFFAYPNGKPGEDFAPEHVALVKELGFKAALTTQWAVATRQADFFQLPRFTPWDRQPLRFGLRLMASRLKRPD